MGMINFLFWFIYSISMFAYLIMLCNEYYESKKSKKRIDFYNMVAHFTLGFIPIINTIILIYLMKVNVENWHNE